jgi:hypothetical protein
MDKIKYFVGLDLGQSSDYTALAILERHCTTEYVDRTTQTLKVVRNWYGLETVRVPEPRPQTLRTYAVRHLERFPLGTPYPRICESLVARFAYPPLTGANLVVDQTGVGRAVVDMIRQARPRATIRPITITAGHSVVPDGAGWNVPKKELVSVMQALFQSRRLQVARQLPMAPVLVKELETFRVKITASANETFEAWRERDHDDLVLAVALAAWVGEHGVKEFWIR